MWGHKGVSVWGCKDIIVQGQNGCEGARVQRSKGWEGRSVRLQEHRNERGVRSASARGVRGVSHLVKLSLPDFCFDGTEKDENSPVGNHTRHTDCSIACPGGTQILAEGGTPVPGGYPSPGWGGGYPSPDLGGTSVLAGVRYPSPGQDWHWDWGTSLARTKVPHLGLGLGYCASGTQTGVPPARIGYPRESTWDQRPGKELGTGVTPPPPNGEQNGNIT